MTSVFTTLITGDDSDKPIAFFTTKTLVEAANVVNAYLPTLCDVDVTDTFVLRQFASPYFITKQEPPREDGLMSVPTVGFTYNADAEGVTLAYRVHTTIHDRTCRCPIHHTFKNLTA